LRALIVSDIHSNIEAFQSVIDDARLRGGFDQVWSLGDLVGYGPDPEECIELIQGFNHLAVTGNHDLASIGRLGLDMFNSHAAAANRWTATRLSDEHRSYLDGLELRQQAEGFTLVHGSPRDPVWEYVVSADSAQATFEDIGTPWCLVGHSHIPFVCRDSDNGVLFTEAVPDLPVELSSEKLIINPGGVGQPRDADPRASYAVFDSGSSTITHHRVEYDIAATQEKMRRHDLPPFLIERLAYGR
jgi:diadenosine tetraphosphatase ApaH/serine/threonine PP2A family protein phosphatase